MYEEFIYKSRYARWMEDEGRRENFPETVSRYLTFMVDHVEKKHRYQVPASLLKELETALLRMDVVPSMRAFMTAGAALERSAIAGFNCSFTIADSIDSIVEVMTILMCGTGVGYSVERHYTEMLPRIPDTFVDTDEVIVVEDSKAGWSAAFHRLLTLLWQGKVPSWDVSKVRPKGARLKTFGGRASGPEPLVDLFQFCIAILTEAAGRKLEPIEVHDILCKVADIVVVGGVRRSAMISLSDLNDHALANAKGMLKVLELAEDSVKVEYSAKGGKWVNVTLHEDEVQDGKIGWWRVFPHRTLSNNSAVYEDKPDAETFLKEWHSLVASKSGERGIFNRAAARAQATKNGRRDASKVVGTNPCCFTGDMKLLTEDGYVEFQELAGRDNVRIVSNDGTITEGQVWSSGVKPVVLVSTEMVDFRVTADHIFMLADGSECEAGDLTGRWIKAYNDQSDELVVQVQEVGEEEVFDFTEPLNHWGVVNGFVVHNSEIILRPFGTCNLSEVIVRATDTFDDLSRKVRQATILGTLQATLTDFDNLRPIWKENAEEERLLGVSMTGIMDHPVLQTGNPEYLERLREVAVAANKELADKIGINVSTAITTVKPSGCRPADGLVTTSGGILTLGEMLLEHHATTSSDWADINTEVDLLNGASAVKTFINGEAPVIEIAANYGISVRSTPNHQWGVQHKGWVRADEIKPGDVLEIEVGKYRSTAEAALRPLNVKSLNIAIDAASIQQPNHMTPDLAWLLGYLWGDGAMSPTRYRLRWCDRTESNFIKLKRVLKEQFDIDADYQRCSNKDAWELTVSSKVLWHWLIKNSVWKYMEDGSIDHIPQIVRQSSQESIIAFLAGLLDADGWVGEARGHVRVTLSTGSASFSRHIQEVGMAVGVVFGRSLNSRGSNLQRRKEIYLMALTAHSTVEALGLLKKHSTRIADEGTFTDHTQAALGVVKEVKPLGILPTFDIESSNKWFWAGAVKSHNTVSQLTNTASGIHARHSHYYIRTVRGDKKDPITRFLIDQGVPYEPCVVRPDTTVVFSFPIKAPEGSITRNDMDAIEQLEAWLAYQRHWCEHKPSCTVSVKDDEWVMVGAWVYEHFDEVAGISFLPHSDHVYQQAPYQEIDEDTYVKWASLMPKSINWSLLSHYETEDMTTGSQTLACSAGVCELVDI